MTKNNLFKSVSELQTSQEEVLLYGSLGIPLGGQRLVEVTSRSGYVYVRLRDSTSEVIQAQNDAVSPIYDLPVILYRRGNRYAIKGRDTERYENWGTFSPFLPRHGEQHSMNPAGGGGGDVTFIWGNQFMPMLTLPSGSNGAGGVILAEYMVQDSLAGWKYMGNTGTQNLLGYKPTGSSSVMVLVYLDTVSGNPGIIVGSGSYFPNTITGTAQIAPYIPAVQSTKHLPSAAIRLSSGTSIIGWDNVYDLKQYYSALVTGSSSGSTGSSSGLPLFITGSIPYAGANGVLKENNPRMLFDDEYGVLWLGGRVDINIQRETHAILIKPTGTNVSQGMGVIAVGTGTSGSPVGFYNGYRARGTDFGSPNYQAVQKDDALLAVSGFGFDGNSFFNQVRMRMYANADWTGTNRETRFDFDITPTGSSTRRTGFQIFGDSVNITNTGTYNVNGIPHTHAGLLDYDQLHGEIG